MADKFMPNLEAMKRVSGAPSFLGSGNRIGTARPMSEYEALGRTRDRDLHFVVANGVPDSTTTKSASAVSLAPTPRQPSVFHDAFGTWEAYQVSWINRRWTPGPDWQGVLLLDPKDTGLDMNLTKGYKEMTVENTSKVLDEAGRAHKPARFYQNNPVELAGDLEGKFMLILMEFRDQDYAQGSCRLPINELAWQTFLGAAAADTQSLQVIFIADVRNNGFQNALEDAHADTMRPIDKPTVWTRRDEPHFSRLLGTESVSGKVLQLTNHHEAVGNKRVAKIVTATRFVKDAQNRNNGQLTVALVLEPIPEVDLAQLRTTL